MGAVCKLIIRINEACFSKFFLQNVPLRGVLKGLQLSKFSEILNGNVKVDKYSNHSL